MEVCLVSEDHHNDENKRDCELAYSISIRFGPSNILFSFAKKCQLRATLVLAKYLLLGFSHEGTKPDVLRLETLAPPHTFDNSAASMLMKW
jgi:hypothetical protein